VYVTNAVLVTDAVGQFAVTFALKFSVTVQPTGIRGTLTTPVDVFNVGVAQLDETEGTPMSKIPEVGGSVISTSNASVVPLLVTVIVKRTNPPGATVAGDAVFTTSSLGSRILTSVLFEVAAGVGAPLMKTL
jgi:hypothetical protein